MSGGVTVVIGQVWRGVSRAGQRTRGQGSGRSRIHPLEVVGGETAVIGGSKSPEQACLIVSWDLSYKTQMQSLELQMRDPSECKTLCKCTGHKLMKLALTPSDFHHQANLGNTVLSWS